MPRRSTDVTYPSEKASAWESARETRARERKASRPPAAPELPLVCTHSMHGDPRVCSLCHQATPRVVTDEAGALYVDGVLVTERGYVLHAPPPRNVKGNRKSKAALDAKAKADDDASDV